MNLVKTLNAYTMHSIEEKINKFLEAYEGELLQVQVIRISEEGSTEYEAIISYKQSDPTKQ
ncbi:Uncharacterised protein [Acinetobacter baumannii]|uniref:hypothetical protein n=1 Tax=Acinetobacter baumannii TaxID=470 RepID=UPI000DE6EE24|nr:hypothetical protein [Acinetobacter baumannii]SSQ30465.1 Uncharacterised protein [Acinetobacter baumannii]HCQ9936236.1 hypothetical protein [Acinetobacter baumannii]